MGAPVLTLRDDFEDNATAAAWVAAVSGSATAAETSGEARFTLPSSTAGTHVARYTSRSTYDLSGGGSFFINIDTMVSTSVAATAFFQLFLSGANALQWIQLSGMLYARAIVAGVSTDHYSVAWNATTYKYLRIATSAGNVLWQSSTDGSTWTTRATVAGGALFTLTDLSVDFGATCGNIASPGSFRLDDVNLILPALATTWRWTQVVWPLANRYTVVTLALDAAATAQGYVVTADGIDVNGDPSGNVRYWSGPADGGRLLTEQASQAAAQAMAVNLPLDGRFDLPTIIEARCIRVYHRSIDGAAYTLREVYPRRLVQADDIEAESIRALHIAVGSITADRLTVTELSAITANMGTLTAGSITGGTIDGAVIYAGSGNEVALDNSGVTFTARTVNPYTGAVNAPNNVKWKSGATTIGSLESFIDLTDSDQEITVLAGRGTTASYLRFVQSISSGFSSVRLQADNDSASDTSNILLSTASALAGIIIGTSVNTGILLSAGSAEAHLTTTDLDVNVPLTLSNGGITATEGATFGGAVAGTVTDAVTAGATTVLTLGHNSTGTPAAGFAADLRINLESSTTPNTNAMLLRTGWATATHGSRAAELIAYLYDTGPRECLRLAASGSAPMIGFLGAAAVTRRTVGTAAPAGGTGATAGAYDTAANRNAMITLVNNMRQAGIDLGLWST